MTKTNSKPIADSTWTGVVPIEDTALAVTDTGGSGVPVVYLNESYTSQPGWRPVIAELGGDWRHITYDERARSKSKRSSDYSPERNRLPHAEGADPTPNRPHRPHH